MDYTIGIDLGTSAVKLLLVREDGLIEKSVSKEYPIFYPAPGFSEQNPEDWWNAVRTGIKELLTDFDCSKIQLSSVVIMAYPFGPAEVPAPPPPVEEPSQLNA